MVTRTRREPEVKLQERATGRTCSLQLRKAASANTLFYRKGDHRVNMLTSDFFAPLGLLLVPCIHPTQQETKGQESELMWSTDVSLIGQ